MTRKLALITLLSLLLTCTATAAPGVVDLALQDVGAGSVAEMKSRIFSLPFTVYGRGRLSTGDRVTASVDS